MDAVGLLHQALAARERGNLEAAFWLLDEAARGAPADPELAVALWDVACSLGRAPAAAGAGAALVQWHAGAGAPDLALRYYAELAEAGAETQIAGSALVHLFPILRERVEKAVDDAERDEAQALYRRALAEAANADTLSADAALAIFEAGREVAPDSVRRAAEVAASALELEPSLREEISRWLAAAPEPRAEPTPGAARGTESGGALTDAVDAAFLAAIDPDGAEPAVPPEIFSDDEIAAAAQRLPPRCDRQAEVVARPEPVAPGDLAVIEAVPVAFGDEALELRLPPHRTSRVGWNEIEAVAAAEIGDTASPQAAVVDCILNWSRRDREPLRIVRLRSETFELGGLGHGEHGLGSLLAGILERCNAIPLPSPESALGLQLDVFESLGAYEDSVLTAACDPDPSAPG